MKKKGKKKTGSGVRRWSNECEVVCPEDHLRLATATAKEASRKKVADRYNMLARRIEVLSMVVKVVILKNRRARRRTRLKAPFSSR